MKKLILALSLILLAGSARAQTPADVLATYNLGVCEWASLSAGCTDPQVLAVHCITQPEGQCVDKRTAEQKIYATPAAFAAAVLLPPRQQAFFAARRDIILARLMRIMTTDPVKCAAVLTAAGIADQTVCK